MAKVIKFSRAATAALDLLQRHINPVVLRPGDKRPVHDDWHKRPTLTAEQIPHVFTGNHNLGAQLGPRCRVRHPGGGLSSVARSGS